MRDRERRDDDRERPQLPEWDDEAKQEEKVIDAAQNMPEACNAEIERGLMPTRVEMDQPRIAVKLERARAALRRNKPQHGGNPLPEPIEARINRKG